MYVVYKHTCVKTNKSYIGLTKNIIQRSHSHRRQNQNCPCFRRAIEKHGWDNFVHDVLAENLTLDEANALEEKYIKEYNTLAPDGYNLKSGGQHMHQHPRTKQILSEKNKGKVLSQETKDKIGLANRGKILSEETRRKCSIAKKGKPGRKQSPELIARRLVNRHDFRKAVVIVLESGELHEFVSIKEASDTLHISRNIVSRLLHNKPTKRLIRAYFKDTTQN